MKPWHILLISFKNEASAETRREIYNRFLTLDKDCGGIEAGIIFWSIGENTDLRKGVHLVQISVFENNDALDKYRQHYKHRELTDLLCRIADWQVGDILAPYPPPKRCVIL